MSGSAWGRQSGAGGLVLDGVAVGIQEIGGGERGVGVEVEHPPQGRLPGAVGQIVSGGGVTADQVVHTVAAGGVLTDERCLFQPAQHGPGPASAAAGEAAGGSKAYVGSGCDREQPEHLGFLVGQRVVGQREHRGQARGRVGVVQYVECAVAQFVGEVGQRQVRVGVGPAGDDAQREREPAAQAHEFVHRRGFGLDACSAESGDE